MATRGARPDGRWQIDLRGDAELNKKIEDLGTQLNRWIFNRAFKPAAMMFLDPVISRIHHVKHRLGHKKNIRAGAIRRTRKMSGVRLMSKFGTTDPKNDPYYGAFVNWGTKRIKPQYFMEQAFNATKHQAAKLATDNLKHEIEKLWHKGQGPS